MEDTPHNLIEVITTTIPPSLPIQQAADQVGRHNVFVNNKISKGHLNYGYVFWAGQEKGSGQKVVILDKKWEEFVKQCHDLDLKKGKATHLTIEEAKKEAKVSMNDIILAIRDKKITYDEEAGKVYKDAIWERFKKASRLPEEKLQMGKKSMGKKPPSPQPES